MKAFQFRLQKALELRRKQFELEEIRYRQRLGELAEADRLCTELEASVHRVEIELRQGGQIAGRDLAAFERFHQRAKSEGVRLGQKREEAAKRAKEQQVAMVEARRRFRLLEKLRERRLAEWESASVRELEEIAAEGFLAGWARDRMS